MDAFDRERGRAPLTSLVIPSFNPGAIVENTWREVSGFLKDAPGEWEVLFVCDGSTDGTPARLAELARSMPDRARVISYTPNRGKGYAVRQGLSEARGDCRIFTDVDLAYGFDDVLHVAQALRFGADAAIASRTHPESRLVLPVDLQGYAYRRHLHSKAFSRLVRLLLPLTQLDTQAGLKGLSARAVDSILPYLTCDGFGFDCELLTACRHFGLSVAEIPVSVRYEDSASTTGPRAAIDMVRELWQIRRAWRRLPLPQRATPTPAQRRKVA